MKWEWEEAKYRSRRKVSAQRKGIQKGIIHGSTLFPSMLGERGGSLASPLFSVAHQTADVTDAKKEDHGPHTCILYLQRAQVQLPAG